MELVLFVIFGGILLARVLADGGGSLQYQGAVDNIDRWVAKVTNETLEKELLFAISDGVPEYSVELESAYKEIEEMYVCAIKPVYKEYVESAMLDGRDEREFWAKMMLIDSNNPIFNSCLKTNINKLRILLAGRGYLRKEDARNGSRTCLEYTNPVEGVVLKWCADKLRAHGVNERFGTQEAYGTGTGKKYKPPRFGEFQLYYSWPHNGWNFFQR